MTELQDCYSTINEPYGNPREEGRPHRGTDYNRSAGQTILAYDDMIVKHVIDQNKYFGTAIGCQRMTIGGFAGWMHVHNPMRQNTFVPKGGVLGYVAGKGPDAGEDWDGAHIHTTQSSVSAFDAATGGNGLSDPAPVIAEAIKTLTIPTPLQGMRKKMRIIELPGGHFHLSSDTGGKAHLRNMDDVNLFRQYLSGDPRQFNPTEFHIISEYLKTVSTAGKTPPFTIYRLNDRRIVQAAANTRNTEVEQIETQLADEFDAIRR